MRVDFDPEAGSGNGRGRLVFSLLSGDEEAAGSSAEARSEMVNRLAGQAAPLMTRLLRRYGEAHATLRTTAEDPVQALAGLPIDELRRMLRALVTASRTAVGVKVSLRGLRGRVELNGADDAFATAGRPSAQDPDLEFMRGQGLMFAYVYPLLRHSRWEALMVKRASGSVEQVGGGMAARGPAIGDPG